MTRALTVAYDADGNTLTDAGQVANIYCGECNVARQARTEK
jgi:hypothetical protein